MNGYDLTRNWYNYKFDNPSKVRAIHSDLYFYIIDLWNRLGQKKEFGLPTNVTMQLMNIGSYNTYKKTLLDLIDFGFVKLVMDSKNQHSSKIIALSKIDKATDKATDTIIEQRTKEQINNEQALARFDIFWDLYSKKEDTKKCRDKFIKLSIGVQEKILQVVPMYIKKTPDKQFRKMPLTWLNGSCWEDDYSQFAPKPILPPNPHQYNTTLEYEQALREYNQNTTGIMHNVQGHLL